MSRSLPRRAFIKTAGGAAAAGALLSSVGASPVAAAPEPEIPLFPIIPVFLLGTTRYVDFTDFIALSNGVGSSLAYGAAFSGVAYPTTAGHSMVATLPIPIGATLTEVTVLASGPGTVTGSLFAHDMTNGGFVGGFAFASGSRTAPTGQVSISGIPANYAVAADRPVQIWIGGITAATPLAGVRYTYNPVNSGFFPVAPTRVYDSRDAGAGGPLAAGSTRNVSVATATASFGGGTVVPAGAYAITYNLTLDGTVSSGFLATYALGGSLKASAINWYASNQILANGGVVTLGGDRQITVQAGGSPGASTNFLVDITGYYI